MSCPKHLMLDGDHRVTKVPRKVATCPECDGTLELDVYEWDTETKLPTRFGFHLSCVKEDVYGDGPPRLNHRVWQSDWQPVEDLVAEWLGATDV